MSDVGPGESQPPDVVEMEVTPSQQQPPQPQRPQQQRPRQQQQQQQQQQSPQQQQQQQQRPQQRDDAWTTVTGKKGKNIQVKSSPYVRATAQKVIDPVYLTASIDTDTLSLDRNEVVKCVAEKSTISSIRAIVRQSRCWQVTFKDRASYDKFIALETMSIRDKACNIRKVAVEDEAGRFQWVRASKIVRVHWLPCYIKDATILQLFPPGLKVLNISAERTMQGMENGIRRVRVEGEDVSSLPHRSHVMYQGQRISCLITVTGRPPMCLRCNQVGHVRGNCGYKTANTQSYAAKLASAQPEAAVELEVEEDPEVVWPTPNRESVNKEVSESAAKESGSEEGKGKGEMEPPTNPEVERETERMIREEVGKRRREDQPPAKGSPGEKVGSGKTPKRKVVSVDRRVASLSPTPSHNRPKFMHVRAAVMPPAGSSPDRQGREPTKKHKGGAALKSPKQDGQ